MIGKPQATYEDLSVLSFLKRSASRGLPVLTAFEHWNSRYTTPPRSFSAKFCLRLFEKIAFDFPSVWRAIPLCSADKVRAFEAAQVRGLHFKYGVFI